MLPETMAMKGFSESILKLKRVSSDFSKAK